jgi:hypothetical protein
VIAECGRVTGQYGRRLARHDDRTHKCSEGFGLSTHVTAQASVGAEERRDVFVRQGERSVRCSRVTVLTSRWHQSAADVTWQCRGLSVSIRGLARDDPPPPPRPTTFPDHRPARPASRVGAIRRHLLSQIGPEPPDHDRRRSRPDPPRGAQMAGNPAPMPRRVVSRRSGARPTLMRLSWSDRNSYPAMAMK